tara:strand:+ start:4277 stop:4642 length:366 start_codon:yes stop_codon:yes gene_type:complete
MYAIVEIAGKQFLTEVGKELKIPHQKDVEINKKISFDKVLLIVEDDDITIGKPIIPNSKVEVKVINHFRDKKITVFKKKRRKGYKVKNTHRQEFTIIQCLSIKKSNSNSKTKKKTSTKPKK